MAGPVKSKLNVRVEGLAALDQFDAGVRRAQSVYLERSGERLRDQLRAATPRRSGRMQSAWTMTVNAPWSVLLVNTSPGIKARDRGAYIEPKARGVLKFQGPDGVVFTRKAVRQRALNFTRKGLRGRGRIVQEEFARAMGELNQGSGA